MAQKATLDEMREALAAHEYVTLDRDDIVMVLLDGCKGWNNISADEVRAQFCQIFG